MLRRTRLVGEEFQATETQNVSLGEETRSEMAAQWRQIHKFLGGKIFYGVEEHFVGAVMPKARYQHPLMKSIHVLKFTKA